MWILALILIPIICGIILAELLLEDRVDEEKEEKDGQYKNICSSDYLHNASQIEAAKDRAIRADIKKSREAAQVKIAAQAKREHEEQEAQRIRVEKEQRIQSLLAQTKSIFFHNCQRSQIGATKEELHALRPEWVNEYALYCNKYEQLCKKMKWYKNPRSYSNAMSRVHQKAMDTFHIIDGVSGSKGERAIVYYLQMHGVVFEREKTFDDLVNRITSKSLRYDFFLPNHNMLIEFDGEDHFKPRTYSSVSPEEAERKFEEGQLRDVMKDSYAKTNNITLIRIPYTDIKNIGVILAEAIS